MYIGWCHDCDREHVLARSADAEAAAHALLAGLDRDAPEGGKMLGGLVAEGGVVLKAFSGQLDGAWNVAGWAPAISTPDRDDEAGTLEVVRRLDVEIETAQAAAIAARDDGDATRTAFADRLVTLVREQSRAREARRARRAVGGPDPALDEESRADKRLMRALTDETRAVLQPLTEAEEQHLKLVASLREQRADASRRLMRRMHAAYVVKSVGGRTRPMREVFGGDMPSGTGDCCAPKLLHHAATLGLRPLGLAEVWWGRAPGRVEGRMYGACKEKCAPLLGFLLCDAR